MVQSAKTLLASKDLTAAVVLSISTKNHSKYRKRDLGF